MKCPHCLVEVLPAFAFDYIGLDKDGGWGVEYMKCPNHDCQRLIIMLAEGQPAKWGTQEVLRPIRSRWLMRPRGANRPAPPEVPKPFADEYHEAGLVLADSPKASAALARRTLQRLLREIEKVKPADLADEIQEMLDRKTLPSHLAEQIDGVRNIGNFSAHPIKSHVTGEIVDVGPGEAEWNLDTLEGLFDFYFVLPARIKARRDALDQKLKDTGKPPMKGASS